MLTHLEPIDASWYVEKPLPLPHDLKHPLVRAAAWRINDGRCTYCGVQTNPFRDFCVDHILPKARGGPDDLENYTGACRDCNVRKNDRTIEEFRVWAGKYYPRIINLTKTEVQIALTIGRPDLAPEHAVFWCEWFLGSAEVSGQEEDIPVVLPSGEVVDLLTYGRRVEMGLWLKESVQA